MKTIKNESIYRDNNTLITLKPATLYGNIEIPDFTNVISSQACWLMPNVESVNIPDTVTEIGDEAFSLCPNLKSIFIPASVDKMGAYIAIGCHAGLVIYCESGPRKEWDERWKKASKKSISKRLIPVTYNVPREWYEAFIHKPTN